MEYLFSDLTIKLPYKNVNSKTDNWTETFIQKINNCSSEIGLSDIIKVVKEFCKGDKYFLQTVLEALSYSNLLKVKNHSVETIFIPEYRNKLSSHYNSNEWTYPLRFWNEN